MHMGLCSTFRSLVVYGLAIVGLAAVLFVVLAYGWDGEPPEVSLESDGE
ncbi:uncharacterized protein NP_3826A [Natronomonas pharaonis DSM 2160]|uniref:Uncharacterized protein n=1 Tax=Natronomonas pharaonis (strain ATCC 35678 / DSM 2160 / CIP 103997 / JCM 8858 / NBRC 14720 / NCIMB 2260 / Gabara) TaxID=348780 RepID=A0A1U7EXU0_NATPD|nr:uncharacterized protein NP_3826A [Natronomonas pharaonis DSM 2160]